LWESKEIQFSDDEGWLQSVRIREFYLSVTCASNREVKLYFEQVQAAAKIDRCSCLVREPSSDDDEFFTCRRIQATSMLFQQK
jgi:hypothetical protein